MKLAILLAALALAGCHTWTPHWADCAHATTVGCYSLTPVAAVP